MKNLIVLILLGFTISAASALGQDPTDPQLLPGSLPKGTLGDEFTRNVPPLSMLIDSAMINSPLLLYTADEIKIKERERLSARREWTENIGVESSFKYGMFDNFYVTENPAEALNDSYLSTSEQFRYSAGVTVRLPIFDIYDRRNQLKIAELRIRQSKRQLEETQNEIKTMVIGYYHEMISKHNILMIRNQEYLSTELQLQMAENQFKNGEIPLSDLTRYKSTHIKSMIDLETAKSEFLTSYMILREVTGVKF